MGNDNFGGPAEPQERVPLPSALRWVAALAVGLIVAVAAFLGGWATGRTAPKIADTALGQPVAPAPADWTEWKYPGAKEEGSSSGGGSTIGSARLGPLNVAQMSTPDGIDQVLMHYSRQLAQPTLAGVTTSGSGGGSRYIPGGMELYNFSSAGSARPGVKEKLITYRTSTYDLVIQVSRADADKNTRITVSYMPLP